MDHSRCFRSCHFICCRKLVVWGEAPAEVTPTEPTVAATEPSEDAQIAAIQNDAAVIPDSGVPAAALTPTLQANNTLADLSAVALSEATSLRGTSLTVTVQDGSAVLTGQVATHIQRKEAEGLLLALDGINSVTIEGVAVTARTRGAKHTVVSGDTLSKLAYDYYGDASSTKKILNGNRTLLKVAPIWPLVWTSPSHRWSKIQRRTLTL